MKFDMIEQRNLVLKTETKRKINKHAAIIKI